MWISFLRPCMFTAAPMCMYVHQREGKGEREGRGNLVVYEPKSDVKCLVLMERRGLQAECGFYLC